MAGSQAVFDIQPGTDITQILQFQPVSVTVDNYSPYWIYLPDAGRYVPPYTTGGTYPLKYAKGAKIVWAAPQISGIAQLPLIPTAGMAHFNFTDEQMVYTPATAIPNQVFLQSQAFTINEGDTLDLTATPLDFLAMGVRVDNAGGTTYALGSTGMTAPQWTSAFTVDIMPPFNSIVIAPTPDPAGRSNTTRGGPVTITFYASQIGNSPGISIPAPADYYLANGLISNPIAAQYQEDVASDSVVFGIANVSAGNTVYLRSLTITNPVLAQSYSLYQATFPQSPVPATVFAPTRIDSNSPVFPASIIVPYQRDEMPTSGVSALATATTTTLALTPTNGSVGDLLIAYVVAPISSVKLSTYTGWTLLAASTVAQVFILAKIATSATGSGDVANLVFDPSGVGYSQTWGCVVRHPASYAPASLISYGYSNAAISGSSTTYYAQTTVVSTLAGYPDTMTFGCAFFSATAGMTAPSLNRTANLRLYAPAFSGSYNLWVWDAPVYYAQTDDAVTAYYTGWGSSTISGVGAYASIQASANGQRIQPVLGLLLATLPTAPLNTSTSYDLHTLLGQTAAATPGTGLVLVGNGNPGYISFQDVNLTLSLQD